MSVGVITSVVTANAGIVLMARVLGVAGQPVTPGSIATIAWQATDLLAGTIAGSGTFTVASSIFANLVTNDPRWTADAIGYNFLGLIPAGTLPAASPGGALQQATPRPYQIDVKFTGADGSIGYAVYQCMALPVYF